VTVVVAAEVLVRFVDRASFHAVGIPTFNRGTSIMKPFVALVLLGIASLFSAVSALAADPKVGDTVAAKWTDGKFYIGTVSALSAGGANVQYEDGDKRTVPLDELIVLSKDADLHVGDHVLAAWKLGKMFGGVITAVTPATCTVKWDDGDTPLEVAKGRMAPFPN
jgi:hypothetical protein